MLNALTALSRRSKQGVQVAYDALAGAATLWLVLWLNQAFLTLSPSVIAFMLALAAFMAPATFGYMSLYRAVVRYFSASVGLRLALACISQALLLVALIWVLSGLLSARIFFDLALTLFSATLLPRAFIRWWLERRSLRDKPIAVIYGAGAAGRQLLAALHSSGEIQVAAFLDDDMHLAGSNIMGLTVHAGHQAGQVIAARRVSMVMLAMPSAGIARRNQIVRRLESLNVHVLTVPGIQEIMAGQATISQLKDVAIEDLLGRDPVPPMSQLIGRDITGKSVLVTGAGGSIGSELCRQVLQQRPLKLVLLESTEFSLYLIEQELTEFSQKHAIGTEIVCVLGSVLDRTRVATVLRVHQVQAVYHAAAYKHVPLVEANATRAISNNALGTWVVASAALAAGVQSFVLVSTDKAVRPTNVMGASKRIAELGVQAIAALAAAQGCRFSVVRFGNVLGSSGSVVPLFRRQIAEGGPLTITHKDIIRYFMTIPEAAQLVIQAGAIAKGGDVFVLDMGEPVKIVDLATRMVHLSGRTLKSDSNPGGDIELAYTGLRPGEKLFEELLVSGQELTTEHPRIKQIFEPCLSYAETSALFAELEAALVAEDLARIRQLLVAAPLEWTPHSETLTDAAISG